MSKTLFWYVFKDLVKVFLMASGALAGIMSFGGLLRPLTQHGLDGPQVVKLLTYFMPAMSTYSVPVAALFATTIVYGRMAADNEITACRASGISMSIWGLAMPALLLGVLVSILSMGLLCFTVPNATMKVEKIIYSNLAKLVAHEIESTHETHFGNFTIFAQQAQLPAADPSHPYDQSVALKGPLIVSYVTPPDSPDKFFHVVKQFWMAGEAIAYIHEDPVDSSATLRATLVNGVTFPRRFNGPKNDQAGLGEAIFGPYPIPSRLGQKTKFMNIFELKNLEQDPTRAASVQLVLKQFVHDDQSAEYRKELTEALNGPADMCAFDTGGDHYTLTRAGATLADKDGVLTLTAPAGRPITFRQTSGGRVDLTVESKSAKIVVDPDTENDNISVSVEMNDALVDAGDMPSPKESFPRQFVVPMTPAVAAIKSQTAEQVLNDATRSERDRNKLLTTLVDIINRVRGEINSRLAFVVSCLLLVLVGAALGMMFKSGNFLTAFAVSVLPAMLSTVLIVTGQHTVENTPLVISATNNPLMMGLELIWTGNVCIAIAAIGLQWRLWRQ